MPPVDQAALETEPEIILAPHQDRRWRGRVGWSLFSLLALFAVWQVLAFAIDSSYFPDLIAVSQTVLREASSGALFWHIGVTLARVAASFAIAMIIGTAIGVALGLAKSADRFFDSWLLFFLNLPALVIIFLCYVWFGLTEVAAITAVVLNKIPNVAIIMREGARSLSRDLAEMALVYRFGWEKTLLHVILPQLAPFFAAAARGGLSLVWKIVLVVELFGRSEGVGVQLNLAFQNYEVATIFAYAITFILVVQVIELGILQPLEARMGQWRR